MSLMDTITSVIANPHRVRDSQNRASERMYRGLDQKMKAVRDTSPEVPPTTEYFPPSSSAVSSRSPSCAVSPERPRRPLRPRPELQRSQSDLPVETQVPTPKHVFAPCITANELTSDETKRNYSHDDLQKWDRTKSPLPPLFPLQGIGRYRHSINADPQWRQEHFMKQINSMDGLEEMTAELDMSEVGAMTQEEWEQLTGAGIRRGSLISSNSTGTRAHSSCGLNDPPTDTQPGTRVARGFSPAASSSTRSSFTVNSRKGSTLSAVAKFPEGESPLCQRPQQPYSTIVSPDRKPSGLLTTITEQSNLVCLGDFAKKVERACHFTGVGDPESAVASDIDDDETEWMDEPEPAKTSLITRMAQGGNKPEPQLGLSRVRTTSSDKKRGRPNPAAIDRHKTVRQPQTRRRKSSKIQPNAQQTSKPDSKEMAHVILPTPESPDDGQELVMLLRKPAKDALEKPKRRDEMVTGSPGVSDDGTLVAEHQLEYQPRAPRHRSSTTVFCRGDVGKLTKTEQQAC